jgi:ABC-type multidrug transport system fused ATPase/permease subunit
MENNELQKIWRSIDLEITQKSKDELELLLTSKARQTVNKFLSIIIIDIIVCAGVLSYVTITTLDRKEDLILLINNLSLGIITIVALLSGLFSWYKLQNNKFDQPLRNWLEVRIRLLSKGLTGRFSKLYLYLIPVLYVLIVLSIHVYFEHKLFLEVLKTEESLIALIVAAPIGIFVSYYGARKIRKYKLSNLEFLKDLYGRVINER